MSEPANQALVIPGAIVLGPGGSIETVTGTIVIGNLTGKEVLETLADITSALSRYDLATGEPAK